MSLLSVIVTAQVKDKVPNFSDEYFLIKDGDSLVIELNEVTVLPRHKFKSKVDMRYYLWLRKKVFKAYPYAILASKRLDSIDVRLRKIKSNSKKRKYIRRVQKYVENELSGQLKKMTRTEGRILIKLIHRQTGRTAFENIKELRSGWKAFWYNTTANLFKLSLKDEYKPAIENEDYLIEDIIQRAYIDEVLVFQNHKLDIKPLELIGRRKGEINVDKYKDMFAKMRKKRKNKKVKRNSK